MRSANAGPPKPRSRRRIYDPALGKQVDAPVYWRFDLVPGASLKRVPQYWRVYEIVRRRIEDHEYPVGSFLPPEAELCAIMGVSRTTIRKAVESYGPDLKVVVCGTGGMSHQIHGARSGMINKEFDTYFLDRLATAPAELTKISHAEYVREVGAEGIAEPGGVIGFGRRGQSR